MKKLAHNYKSIKGWGVDANPDDLPAYPMKHRIEEDNKGMVWVRPTQQHASVEILKSNERPSFSAVIGTTVPPSGLSGIIRRFAFKHSESSYFHWLPLILADRINVAEGIIDDLKRGYVPNLLAERGIKAALKYNPRGVAKKVAIGAVIVTGAIAYISYRKNRNLEPDQE